MRSVFAAFLLLVIGTEGHAHAQSIAEACKTATLCAGIKPGGGGLVTCLRDHLSELSDACFTAFGRAALTAAPKPAASPQPVASPQPAASPPAGQVLQSDGTYAPAPK